MAYLRFIEDGGLVTAIVTENDIEKGRFFIDLNSLEEAKKAESLGVDMRYAYYAYESSKL